MNAAQPICLRSINCVQLGACEHGATFAGDSPSIHARRQSISGERERNAGSGASARFVGRVCEPAESKTNGPAPRAPPALALQPRPYGSALPISLIVLFGFVMSGRQPVRDSSLSYSMTRESMRGIAAAREVGK